MALTEEYQAAFDRLKHQVENAKFVVVGLRLSMRQLESGGEACSDVYVESVGGGSEAGDFRLGSHDRLLTLDTMLEWLEDLGFEIVSVNERFVVLRQE